MSITNKSAISEELNSLGEQLLSLLFIETMTKLQLFQRGLRLNASVSLPPLKPRNEKMAKTNDNNSAESTDENLLNAIKFDKELDTLLMVLAIAKADVRPTNTNEKKFQQIILTLKGSDGEVDVKAQELRIWQTTLLSLKSQIETQHNESTKHLKGMNERIATLRHNLHNGRRLNDLEFELVQRWEANRYIQASIVCNNEERALQQEIADLDRHISAETIIIAEVQKFNSLQFDDFRVKIEEWKNKYENEMAKVTDETVQHENRISELVKIREHHEQTYAERNALMREYLAQKAEEHRLYEQQMHRVSCAIKIQAWWRGVMVRHGLGPYKKKAKKAKKGKGKAK